MSCWGLPSRGRVPVPRSLMRTLSAPPLCETMNCTNEPEGPSSFFGASNVSSSMPTTMTLRIMPSDVRDVWGGSGGDAGRGGAAIALG